MKNDMSIAIIGPTSSGKSDIAITLAIQFDGEVIGADSRQIYRDMNIGSGKEPGGVLYMPDHAPITQKPYMCGTIPHYMIDIVHPRTPYSMGKFLKKAQRIRKDIWHRKKLPIICGGTMFWAQALVEDQEVPHVLPDPTLRKELTSYTTEDLFALLAQKDPHRAQAIDSHNRPRVIRAIEIATVLGTVPQLQKPKNTAHDTLIIAISHPRELLYDRIATRLQKRLDAGMLDEVCFLHTQKHVSWKRLEEFGLEYKWCALLLQKKITQEEMFSHLLQESRRYAKRQETWIRRWEKQGATIHHITTSDEAIDLTQTFLSKNS